MADYTPEEIQTAVEKLVKGAIRRPTDTLGTRRTDITFGDVQEAAAGVFILYPLTPFYAVFLGTQRLQEQVTAVASLVTQLRANVGAVGRRVLPVDEVENLFNAEAALLALEGAVAETAPKDITKVPAFQRFASNVSEFLVKHGSKIKDAGTVVPTPVEARLAIPGLMRRLTAAHQTLLDTTITMANAVEDYNALNLPTIVARGVVSKARQVLGDRADQMDALSPEARLAGVRDVVLDLLAAKAVVQRFGSFTGVSSFFLMSGTGQPYSDATHLATPAQRIATVPTPHTIVPSVSDQLAVLIDQALGPATQASGTLTTTGVFVDGETVTIGAQTYTLKNPFVDVANNIDASGTTATTLDNLRRAINGVGVAGVNYGTGTTVHVSVSATATATTLAVTALVGGPGGNSIATSETCANAFFSGATLVGGVSSYIAADLLTLNQSVNVTMNGIRAEQTIIAGTGFVIDNLVNDELKFKTSDITGPGVSFSCTLTDSVAGVPRTAVEICTDINAAINTAGLSTEWLAEPYFFPATFLGTVDIVNAAGAIADFNIPLNSGDMSFVALGNLIDITTGPNAGLWTVTVLNSSTSITASKNVGVATNQAGVRISVGDAKRAVRIKSILPLVHTPIEARLEIVADTTLSQSSALNLGLGTFSAAFCYPLTAQQVADDLVVKLPAKIQATAIVTGTTTPIRTVPGNNLSLIVSKKRTTGQVSFAAGAPNTISVSQVSGLLAAGVVIGDVIVLRGGTPTNTEWTITALTDTTATAQSTDLAVNGVGVTMDFGEPTPVTRWMAVDIPLGPTSGRYYISGPGETSLDLPLLTPLSLNQDPTTKEALITTGTVGEEFLVINSRSATVASSIAIDPTSTALNQFFLAPPAMARGTSPWFQLPSVALGLEREDLLDVFLTDYSNPSVSYVIQSVSSRILGILPEMPSTETWTFNDQPPPFARLKHGHTVNFGEFKKKLDIWIARSINEFTYYRDLNRFLNPLLHNANPTNEEVGTALTQLEMLLDYLIVWDDSMVPAADALASILTSYVVQPVNALDVLIKSYKEKGADRAVDLLLQGQFSTFFNMDIHDVSYAGTMQKSMRSLMQEDLPVRKTERQDLQRSRLISSTESPDFEYDQSDVDRSVTAPEPPGDFGR